MSGARRQHSHDQAPPGNPWQQLQQQQQQQQQALLENTAASPLTRHHRSRHVPHAHQKQASASTDADLSGPVPSRSSPSLAEVLGGGKGSSQLKKPSPERASHRSSSNDAKKWFDNSNQNPMVPPDAMSVDVDSQYFQKESVSSAEESHIDIPDIPLVLDDPFPILPGPSPSTRPSFLPPDLAHNADQSSIADDYRSVIDDLTIENKRLKEELKRFRQVASRDSSALEREKLFEIKVHGLPRRKKQELETTLRNFAASLDNSASSDSTSRNKREKSATPSRHKDSGKNSHSGQGRSSLSATGGSGAGGSGSGSGGFSKHASTSSSRSRPVDSAYASMSTGANSSGTALVRPSFGGPKARTTEQKVERYLQDIPEGLHPNFGLSMLSDKDRKKLIVRRLEQLFTGKIGGRYSRRNRAMPPPALMSPADGSATVAEASAGVGSGSGGSGGSSGSAGLVVPVAASIQSSEPLREARIQAQTGSLKRRGSRDNLSQSNSNSNGDEAGTGTGAGNGNGQGNGNGTGHGNGHGNGHGHGSGNGESGNGNGSGMGLKIGNGSRSAGVYSGNSASGNGNGHGSGNGHGNGNGNGNGNGHGKSPDSSVLEQRPTRPRDLDPDRVQVPSENMEYIRHLGLVPPEIEPVSKTPTVDVSPDADGWVYLNLLANLAQLHIFNVAPDFIRKAIVEKSTKFQLSPDGQKVRWRGGIEGTKFSSDGSTENSSQQSTSTDEAGGSDENGRRKKTKTSGDGSASAPSSKRLSKFGPHDSGTSSRFHYKPLFVQQKTASPFSSGEELDSRSSVDLADDSRHGKGHGHSRSSRSLSGSSSRRKRNRVDGVLVYYTGAPFCTDLAGESGETSPTTCLTSTGLVRDSTDASSDPAPDLAGISRSSSGVSIPFRPLTDYRSLSKAELEAAGLSYPVGLLSDEERGGDAEAADEDESMNGTDVTTPLNVYDSDMDFADFYDGTSADTPTTSESEEGQPPSADPLEPFLEASGIGRVFPEDHFSLLVTTRRNARRDDAYDEDEDEEKDDAMEGGGGGRSGSKPYSAKGAFHMGSLMKRLAALKRQSAPISGALPRQNQENAPGTGIAYVSAVVRPRDPVALPPPATFYPPFSPSSESDFYEDSSGAVDEDDEDESMLASSEEMISRRANPHQSDNNASPASQALDMSGDVSDVEADGMNIDDKDDDDM